ncbi:MAG: hypothetical protein R2713_00705 [Ilumatobacteraceae bacterium]
MSRRFAFVAAVAVLGLSACGTEDAGSAGAPTTSVLAPAVIEVAGGVASGGGSATPMSADATAEASTKMMAAYLTYLWSGDAPDLTSPAASWSFPVGAAPTSAQIEALASALGVAGDVTELGPEIGGGWTIGPNDGTAPSLTVGVDAMQTWWYSPAWATMTPTVVDDCALYPPGDPAGNPETAEMPACGETAPPENVPTADEAEAKARELFASLGVDATSFEFETYADEWGASVTGFLVLDGIRTTASVNVGYGAEGALTWASGFLASPQRGADYPRIGVEAAVQRLNDQTAAWMTGVGPMARNAADVAVSSDAAAESGSVESGVATEAAPPDAEAEAPIEAPVEEPIEEPTDSTGPSEEPTEPVPSDTPSDTPSDLPSDLPLDEPLDCSDPAVSCLPVEDPEPIEITLDRVTASLEQVWAADGTVWLLPGYAFANADGPMANVLAIPDEFLVQTDPMPMSEPAVDPVPEPMPAPAPGDTTVVVGGGVSGDPGDPAEPVEATILPFDESSVVGMPVDEATKVAEGSGWSVRVARQDGEDLALTMDFLPSRLNVAVEAGVITEVLSVG